MITDYGIKVSIFYDGNIFRGEGLLTHLFSINIFVSAKVDYPLNFTVLANLEVG